MSVAWLRTRCCRLPNCIASSPVIQHRRLHCHTRRSGRNTCSMQAVASQIGPVLSQGDLGALDDAKIGCGVAHYFAKEQVYRMWYYANSKAEAEALEVPAFLSCGHIFLAESQDGVKWEKKGPVIKPNRDDDAAYDRGGLGLTGIAEVDGDIWLPTFGVSKIIKDQQPTIRLGLARSRDGLHWTKVQGPMTGGCVLEKGAGDDFDSLYVMCPGMACLPSGKWLLYYHASKPQPEEGAKVGKPERSFWDICYAESDDGLHYTKRGRVTWTKPKVPSDFGGRAGPGVLPNPYGPGLLMFYTAIAEEEVGVYGKWSIGCATSDDGVSWTRVGEKAVIEGTPGEYDEQGAGHPSAFLGSDGLLRVIYHAFPNKGIGEAVMTHKGDLTSWQKIW